MTRCINCNDLLDDTNSAYYSPDDYAGVVAMCCECAPNDWLSASSEYGFNIEELFEDIDDDE